MKNFDEIISITDSDFKSSALTKSSVIRLGFLAVISSKKIIGTIGSISEERHQRLLSNLSNYLVGNLKIE